MTKRTRTQLDLGDRARQSLLEATQLGEHTTNAETIRRAIELYRRMLEEKIAGSKIIIEGADGSRREIVIL